MELLLVSLSVFAISHAIVYKDGPLNVFYYLRKRFDVFECVPCLSFWIAILLILFYPITVCLAAWGLTILLDRLTLRFT